MKLIGLVGCSRLKLPHRAPARHLYLSPLFRAASRYCQVFCDAWFVLSAKHGLVHPDTVLEPYDYSLKGLTYDQRAQWAIRVFDQMLSRRLVHLDYRYRMFAGRLYTHLLANILAADLPLRGLGIGQRLSWFISHP